MQADGSTISMSGGKKQDEIVEDVSKVCLAALEKKVKTVKRRVLSVQGAGSLLLAHDVRALGPEFL